MKAKLRHVLAVTVLFAACAIDEGTETNMNGWYGEGAADSWGSGAGGLEVHWAKNAIDLALSEGLVNTESLQPAAPMERQQAAALISNAFSAADAAGIDRPGDAVTIAEVLALISRTAGWEEAPASSASVANAGQYFIQGPAVEQHWAAELVREAIARGALALEANPHNLDLDRPASQAEVIAMTMRARNPEEATSAEIARHLVSTDDLFDESERWTTEEQLQDSFDFMIESFWARATDVSELTSPVPNGQGGIASLSYVTFTTPVPDQERAALVVINGRTETYLKYAEFVYDMLAQTDDQGRRFSIYMCDHRGQGFSDRLVAGSSPSSPDTYHRHHVTRFQHYVDDLEAFYNYVVQSRSHRRVFALGHSMGGGITTVYAQQHPDDFDAVVLSAPMHEVLFEGISGAATRAVVEEMRVRLGRRMGCIDLFDGEMRCDNDFSYDGDTEYAQGYVIGHGPWQPDDPASGFRPNGEQNALTHSAVRFDFVRHLWLRYPEVRLGGVTRNWLVQATDATGQLGDDWREPEQCWNMRDRAASFAAPLLLLRAGGDRIVGRNGQEEVCATMNSDGAANCRLEVSMDPATGTQSEHEAIVETDPIRRRTLGMALDFLESCERGACAI